MSINAQSVQIGRNAISAGLWTVYVKQPVCMSARYVFVGGLRSEHLDGAMVSPDCSRSAAQRAGVERAESTELIRVVHAFRQGAEQHFCLIRSASARPPT